MGIKETSTKEVSRNQYAANIIQAENKLEMEQINITDMRDRLLIDFAKDPNNPLEVASGFIDKLALIDPRFEVYKR